MHRRVALVGASRAIGVSASAGTRSAVSPMLAARSAPASHVATRALPECSPAASRTCRRRTGRRRAGPSARRRCAASDRVRMLLLDGVGLLAARHRQRQGIAIRAAVAIRRPPQWRETPGGRRVAASPSRRSARSAIGRALPPNQRCRWRKGTSACRSMSVRMAPSRSESHTTPAKSDRQLGVLLRRRCHARRHGHNASCSWNQ